MSDTLARAAEEAKPLEEIKTLVELRNVTESALGELPAWRENYAVLPDDFDEDAAIFDSDDTGTLGVEWLLEGGRGGRTAGDDRFWSRAWHTEPEHVTVAATMWPDVSQTYTTAGYRTTEIENALLNYVFGGQVVVITDLGVGGSVATVVEGAIDADTTLLSLAQVAVQLREKADLPVQDIAAMCGVKRRQYYNLLQGEPSSFAIEQHMRLVHEVVSDLFERLGRDSRAVRSAILTPLDRLGLGSVFEVASQVDVARLRDAYAALLDVVDADAKLRERPAPSASLRSDDPSLPALIEDHLRRPSAAGS